MHARVLSRNTFCFLSSSFSFSTSLSCSPILVFSLSNSSIFCSSSCVLLASPPDPLSFPMK